MNGLRPACVTALAIVVFGCGRPHAASTPAATPAPSLPAGSPLPAGGGLADTSHPSAFSDTGKEVQPARRAADIVSQLRAQTAQLDLAVQAGRMNEVRARAAAIRALITALPGHMERGDTAEVRRASRAARVAARQLDEAARAGDRASVAQAEAQLRREVSAAAGAVPNP